MTPKGWTEKSLSQLSSKPISYGVVQTGEPVDNGIPCVRVVDLTSSEIDVDAMITTTDAINQSYKKTILEKNDLMIALRGEIGLVRIVEDALVDRNLTRGLARVSPIKSIVYPNFLLWALRSPLCKKEFIRRVNGSALKEISINELRKVPVIFPSLERQKKISNILDTWDDAISTTEKLITAKQKLQKALLSSLLELEAITPVPIGRVCSSIVPARNKPKVFDGDIPWLTIADLEGKMYVQSSLLGLLVSRQELTRIKSKTIPHRTVIMSCVGKFGIAAIAARELVINQQLHGFICGDEIVPEYLCWALRAKSREIKAASGQTTVSYLNRDQCEAIKIKVPSLTEQERIADILNTSQKEINILMSVKEDIQTQKRGLMQKLLTGEWPVTVEGAG